MVMSMLSNDGHHQLDRLRASQLLDQLDKLQSLHQSAERMIADTVAELHEVHERLFATP
ncbi:MAG: hypothetical protein KY460_02460 [Actinobacteria bacterium]|nr:hypothetical protein [Actinomycetota bacterium]